MKNKRKVQKSYLRLIMPVLEWFYRETGITITVLDRDGNPVAHCGGGVKICRYIRQKLCEDCKNCDADALELLLKDPDRCCKYLCHAGLSEAAALVRSEDGDYDGYIIIGKYLTEETLAASKARLKKRFSKRPASMHPLCAEKPRRSFP